MTTFEIGYEAFIDGQREYHNPYDKETSPWSFKQWLKGWSKSKIEHSKE